MLIVYFLCSFEEYGVLMDGSTKTMQKPCLFHENQGNHNSFDEELRGYLQRFLLLRYSYSSSPMRRWPLVVG